MASRSLEDLRNPFRGLAQHWLASCRAEFLDPLVYCTLRSFEEQDALYEIGRTKPGRKVTYARGGQSPHNYGLALDFVPLIGGKPDWRAGSPEYVRCVEIAESLGLESASKWPRFKEWPHLQMPSWRNLI